MTTDFVLALGQEAIKVLLIVSLPLLGVALVVGLVVSIFQSVTQVQEMTLTFIPKIVAVFISLLFLSHWMLGMMMDFTKGIFQQIGNL